MQTNLLVNFEADVWTDSGDVLKINVSGLPALWVWEDGPRESVEFRTAMDYMSENVVFSFFSIVCFGSSQVKEW